MSTFNTNVGQWQVSIFRYGTLTMVKVWRDVRPGVTEHILCTDTRNFVSGIRMAAAAIAA